MRQYLNPHRLLNSLVVSGGMALAMSGAMSFTIQWLHQGAPSLVAQVRAWLPTWGLAFALAWPLAFCLTLVLVPRLMGTAAWLHAATQRSGKTTDTP